MGAGEARPVPVATRGAGGRAAAAMGSWAAATTWRLGGCSGRGGLRGVIPRRRGSSRPGGGDQAATLSDLLQSSVGDEEPGAAAAEAERREQRSPREGTVLLFPGQGSQFVGMGRGLLRYPGVRDMYRLAEKVLGYDLLSLCLEGPRAELDRTRHCQPAVFVASLAAVEKLNHQRPEVSGERGGEEDRGGPLGVNAGPLAAGVGPAAPAARRLPQGLGGPRGAGGHGGEGHGAADVGPRVLSPCRWWRAAWRRPGTAWGSSRRSSSLEPWALPKVPGEYAEHPPSPPSRISHLLLFPKHPMLPLAPSRFFFFLRVNFTFYFHCSRCHM